MEMRWVISWVKVVLLKDNKINLEQQLLGRKTGNINQNCNRDRTREFGPQDCSDTNIFMKSLISHVVDKLCFCVPTYGLKSLCSNYSYLPYVVDSYLSVCLLLGL